MLKSALTKNIIRSPLYDSESNISITSLSEIYPGATVVYYDAEIGHLQTKEIENIDSYYDEDYQFFDQSDEEDILYKVVDGNQVFRQQHQVDTLISKNVVHQDARVLDYGCAKGTVLKRLSATRPDVKPYLFDVSQMYVHLWEKFVNQDQYASYTPKAEWKGTFDLVTSFFAFEHTPDPLKELAAIKELLKDDGLVYLIVPNVYENAADFIVADHVHHYSEISLKYLLTAAGFQTVEIDDTSHFAAFIAIGKKVSFSMAKFVADTHDLEMVESKSKDLASYWDGLSNQIRSYEKSLNGQKIAIYGAGVYGNFISTCLEEIDNLAYFVDQNSLLRGKFIMGKPVIHPDDLPDEIEHIIVGLNPKIAKSAMESISSWENKKRTFFYI